jgi:hypothetical protein
MNISNDSKYLWIFVLHYQQKPLFKFSTLKAKKSVFSPELKFSPIQGIYPSILFSIENVSLLFGENFT